MKNKSCYQHGFTLIELLVVVLIIGILAAIALPQYRVAVTKSKLMSCLPILRAIADGEKAYKMASGDIMTAYVDKLDISLPAGFTSHVSFEDGGSSEWEIGSYKQGLTTIYVRPKSLSLEAAIYDNEKKEIVTMDYFVSNGNETDPIRCEARHDRPLGKKVCKSICGPLKRRNNGNYCGCYLQGTIPDGTETTDDVCS